MPKSTWFDTATEALAACFRHLYAAQAALRSLL